MKILAIETATEACSATIDINNECIHRFEVAPKRHTELILPMIDELLQEADIRIDQLDAIAFGRGPGAFTGVRIAIGVVQGLAFSHDIPVIPISTLAALAQDHAEEHNFVATAIDARMREVYWGMYRKNEQGLMRSVTGEKVCFPADVSTSYSDKNEWFGVGSGWKNYSLELQTNFKGKLIGFTEDTLPSSANVMKLAKSEYLEGNCINVEKVIPIYLRNKIINDPLKPSK